MAHMFGLSHATWHISYVLVMPHGTYDKPKPSHMTHMIGLSHAMWHLGKA
jgi:hypothetical protein